MLSKLELWNQLAEHLFDRSLQPLFIRCNIPCLGIHNRRSETESHSRNRGYKVKLRPLCRVKLKFETQLRSINAAAFH